MTRKSLFITLACTATLLATACSSTQQDHDATPSAAANKPLLSTSLRPYAQPLVPVSIDGKTYHFVLDTGAPYSLIDNHVAAALTRTVPDSEVPDYFRQYISGLSALDGALDTKKVTYWQSKPIVVGTHPIGSSVPWVGIDLSMFSSSYGTQVDGLLGANAYRQLSWGFDNVAHTLTVWALPPSTAGYKECAPFEDSFGAGPDVTIVLKNGNGGSMRIDTGATYENFSTDTIKVLQEQGATIETIGPVTRLSANGTYEATSYLVKDLFFATMPIGQMKIFESAKSNNVGMGFLSRFDSYLFVPSEMLFCFNAEHFTRDDQKPVRLVELGVVDHRILIGAANISPEGLVKGLQSDDVLLAVNDKPVSPTDIEYLRHQLSNMPQGELNLTIEREGKQITVKL